MILNALNTWVESAKIGHGPSVHNLTYWVGVFAQGLKSSSKETMSTSRPLLFHSVTLSDYLTASLSLAMKSKITTLALVVTFWLGE